MATVIERHFKLLVISILVLTLSVTHLALIPATPTESDEYPYKNIAVTKIEVGFPAENFHQGGELEWFTYQPPFYFYLLAGWFQIVGQYSIVAGRVLSSLIATLLVAAVMAYVYVLTRDKRQTIFSGITTSIAGWTMYTSLLIKLDTPSTTIGVIGLTLFMLAIQRESVLIAILSGAVIGFAADFKHIGICFLLVVIVHWILTFRHHKIHAVVIPMVLILIAAYVIGMVLEVKQPYIDGTYVQILRSTGAQTARGLNYSNEVAIQALIHTYWAFAGTIITFIVAFFVALKKAWQHLGWPTFSLKERKVIFHEREYLWLAPLTASVLSIDLILVILKLRNPHYLVFGEWASRAIIVVVAMLFIAKRLRWWRFVVAFLILITGLDVTTALVRVFHFSKADALAEIEVKLQGFPRDSVILGEEWTCSMGTLPCYDFDKSSKQSDIERNRYNYIVVQITYGLQPPLTESLQDLISKSQPIYVTSDWKSKSITIYKTPYAIQ